MTNAQQALAQVREALEAGPTPGPWSVERLVVRLRVAATKLDRSDEWEDLRDDLHHAAAEIEQLKGAAVVALDALETHAKQYPHMQKGYTIDAIGSLRAVLTNGGGNE